MIKFKELTCFYCEKQIISNDDLVLGVIFPNQTSGNFLLQFMLSTDFGLLEAYHKKCHYFSMTTNSGLLEICKKMPYSNAQIHTGVFYVFKRRKGNVYRGLAGYNTYVATGSMDNLRLTLWSKWLVFSAKFNYWTGKYVLGYKYFIFHLLKIIILLILSRIIIINYNEYFSFSNIYFRDMYIGDELEIAIKFFGVIFFYLALFLSIFFCINYIKFLRIKKYLNAPKLKNYLYRGSKDYSKFKLKKF